MKMSSDWKDLIEENVISDCCQSSVYLDDICMDCYEHCTPINLEEDDE